MTKINSVLNHIENYGEITSWEAIKEYGATRLSAIIYVLRHKYGMDIENEWIDFVDRYGSKSRYVKYKYNRKNKRSEK